MNPSSIRLSMGLWPVLSLAGAALLAGCAVPRGSTDRSEVKQDIRRSVEAAIAPTPPRAASAAALLPPSMDLLLPPLALMPRPTPRFDLVVSDTPAALVFQAISQSSQLSIVVPPSLAQERLSVNLKEIDGVEALEVLREQFGFEYRVDGRRVYVQARELSTRIYQLGFPATRRSGSSTTRVASGSLLEAARKGADEGSSSREGAQVTTRIEGDIWAELERALKTIVGTEAGRQLVVSAQTGVIVVRALPRELREVERVLGQMRLSIDRQVLLEAKILEVALNEGYEAGINWAALRNGNHRLSMGMDSSRINVPGSIGSALGVPPGSIVTGVDATTAPATVLSSTLGQILAAPVTSAALPPLAFTTAGFNALLSFLQTQGTVHVLSSPRVAAVNNQKAVLRVGTDDFFLTGVETTTTSTASGSVTTPSLKMQPFFSGISLDVTPQIDDAGMVTLHVRPSVSEVTEKARVVNLGNLGQFNLPLASSTVNETDTIVRVRDGVTVAIGGLMQQRRAVEDARVPGVGDVPAVGALFRRDTQHVEKRELVFLLRPTVVRNSSDWVDALAQLRERLDSQLGSPTAGR